MDLNLDVEVRESLQGKRGDWKRIAIGAGVSHSWISQFVRGKIPNPGYETLRRLHRQLNEPAAAVDAQETRHAA